jgi:drug/metabolite transporter (DMT)-like permease
MIWFPLALAGAMAQAMYSAGAKILLRQVPAAQVAGGSFLVAAISLAAISLLRGFPPVEPGFAEAVLVTVAINTIATILFYKALSLSDLSLCLPILSFTPVFLLITSFVILNEIPSIAGLAGIFLVATGSYMLAANGAPGRALGWMGSFRFLLSDRGVRFMLIVAFLYSISVNFDKVVVERSDPVFGSSVVFGLLSGIFLLWILIPILFRKRDIPFAPGKPKGTGFLIPALGLVLTLEAVSVNTAYTLSLVPYVIAVKRLSVLFGVLIGGYLLREGYIRQRVFGTIVMVMGTVLIAVWG